MISHYPQGVNQEVRGTETDDRSRDDLSCGCEDPGISGAPPASNADYTGLCRDTNPGLFNM